MVSLWSPGPIGQKGRGEEVSVSTEHGGDDVAPDRRLGTPWRARRRAARKRNRAGIGEGATRAGRGSRRWAAAACTVVAGGAAPAAEQGRQGTEGAQGKKEEGEVRRTYV
jgi:hypothetical protein